MHGYLTYFTQSPGVTAARLPWWIVGAMSVLAWNFNAMCHGQTFPTKNLRLVVPTPAGSSVDIAARLIADALRVRLGYAVIIDNRPGGGGTVAAAYVARANADGHSLFVGFNGPLATAPFLFKNLSYRPLTDFSPVIATVSQPHVLAIHATHAARTLPEFIADVKARPGKYSYASVGNASASHLTMELFKAQAGLTLTHVPYNGGPPAVQGLIAGDTLALFAAYINVRELAVVGKLRLLGLAEAKRSETVPNLPTFVEQGVNGVDAPLFNAIVAPGGTPQSVVALLNREIAMALVQGEMRSRLVGAGMEPIGGSPEQLAALIRAEAQRWGPLIRRLGLRLD
jgi:tripartite-type tricarboxylate transporter receptor subunit TctC